MEKSEIEEFRKKLAEENPEFTITEINLLEDESHQTYKTKFEELKSRIEEFQSDAIIKDSQKKEAELENIRLRKQMEIFEKENRDFKSRTLAEFVKFIEKITQEEIVISNVKAMDLDHEEIKTNNENFKVGPGDLADRPGIYHFKRPSFFTPLRRELNKKNEAEKVTRNTKHLFRDQLKFWKKAAEDKETKSNEEIKASYDANRKKALLQILNGDCSNEERYLKYMLITPGIDQDYLATLNGAAEIGLDARIIISLLEQPKETFNREMIEAYVSAAHKGTEFNLRRELAQELLAGSWYITADINGKREKFQLAPVTYLKEIEENLKKIQRLFEGEGTTNSEEKLESDFQEPEDNTNFRDDNQGFQMEVPDIGEEAGFDDSDIMIDGLGNYDVV